VFDFAVIQKAFMMFATWYNVLAIFGGMVIGVVVGCIPGMTGAMAVALVLPFTFHLSPLLAILLLVSIYKGAIYGGSISAILIKTPGTPAAAATVMDGYALAEKGQAGKALYMALYASAFADFTSNLALICFTGFIAQFALRFGPPEFFTLICFSLTVVAGVSEKSLAKGLVSAGMGLFLVSIGIDAVYGTERFCFGNADLMAGLNFIPVLIGLFALPEIISNSVETVKEYAKAADARDSRVTWQDFKRCFKTIVRGSAIGTILGAVPGIGSAPIAFIAYGEARRRSKHPETWGKGELEGVAAAESGNNGSCGTSLVPLLSLGVPGDAITGIILGAFMMHGLLPGPLLYKEHGATVYALFMGIILTSAMMLLVGHYCIRFFAGITKIPKRLLFPAVLLLCFYGCYAINSSLFDVATMTCIGFLGYAMNCWKIPAAPFVIAFVLGPLLEDNMRRSLLMSDGSYAIFLRSPICWFFAVMFFVAIFYIYKQRRVAARR
jgi:putative tricarboxylic transport membrane protein